MCSRPKFPSLPPMFKELADGDLGHSMVAVLCSAVRLGGCQQTLMCTYHRWFSRPAGQACPTYWDVPIGNAKLHRIFRVRMGSHLLPIEQGSHVQLPRNRRICRLCCTGALGEERHMLLECPALADLRQQYSSLLSDCSGVMARLVWAKDQPLVSKYIIACLDRMSC